MVTTHNQPNWVQPRYVYVSRWRESQEITNTRDGAQHASFIYHDPGVFGQFVALFELLNTVVATFSILLFNSISPSQRLSLQVEQMDEESWTT